MFLNDRTKRIVLSFLLLLGTIGCSTRISEDTNYLDLCVAIHKDGEPYILQLDKGLKLIPDESSIIEIPKIGERYKVQYTLRAKEQEDSCYRANIFDLCFIQTIPLSSTPANYTDTKDSEQQDDPIAFKQVWKGGDYINMDFSYLSSTVEAKHSFRLTRACFNTETAELALRFLHDAHGNVGSERIATTVSFPISSIWEYAKAKKISFQVAESDEKGKVVINTHSIAL